MPHPNEPPREIELKLKVPEGAAIALFEHAAWPASAAQQTKTRREVTTYFDTADRRLAHHGMSLRVRCANGRRVQTLKANQSAGVAADRAEWEWPVKHDKPDLSLLAQTPVAQKLPRRLDLEMVLTTDIDRTTRVVELDGGTVVEAAFDEGAIIAGEAREPVRELELELKAGDPAPLFRLALKLHATLPLTIEPQSKAARGYQLRSGQVPQARKAEDVALDRGTTGAEAFRQIVTTELGHLLANQPAALSGDAEGVHQMRVAIRRLRAALELFQPLLEPLALGRFQEELRHVGRVFGEPRDWDVFTLDVMPAALKAAGAESWRTLLQDPAGARREEAHQHFAQELQNPPFTALVLGLAAWVEQKTLLGGPDLQRPIKDLCPRLLDRLAGKAQRRGRHIGSRSDTERHALRKSLKKLRYGIDYLQAVFPGGSVAPYLRRCKKLQKTLGTFNDAVTAIGLADELGKDARPDLAPALGTLAQQLERQRNKELHGLSKRWKAFKAEPRFWA
jgi:inorganic triphosphatase YgiF